MLQLVNWGKLGVRRHAISEYEVHADRVKARGRSTELRVSAVKVSLLAGFSINQVVPRMLWIKQHKSLKEDGPWPELGLQL